MSNHLYTQAKPRFDHLLGVYRTGDFVPDKEIFSDMYSPSKASSMSDQCIWFHQTQEGKCIWLQNIYLHARQKLLNIIILKAEDASGKIVWVKVGTLVSVTWGNTVSYPWKQRSLWRKPTSIILDDMDENNFKVLLLVVWLKEKAYSRGGLKNEGVFTGIKLVEYEEENIKTT